MIKKIICLIMISQSSFAYLGMCPFKATDTNVISLAQETASSLQALLDKKNECNDAVKSAVDSAKSLPDLVYQIQDPASSLLAEQEWVNEEISKSISNPSYGSKIDSISGMSYLDSLIDRREKIPSEISKIRIKKKYDEKESAKAQALYTTQNLISNLSSALSNPDSKCAKAISGGLGARVLTMGLGLVSSASPLFLVGAKATSASLSASLLSDFVNMFSKMPPASLEKFEKNNQTIELACLYYQVNLSHCSMVEQSNSGGIRQKSKLNLAKAAQCIPYHNLYNQLTNLKDLSSEIQDLASSIARNAPLSTSDSGSSAFNREISDLFYKKSGQSSDSESDTAKNSISQFNFLSKYFGPSATLSVDNLSLNDASNLNTALQYYIQNQAYVLKSAGIGFKTKENATDLTLVEQFKANYTNMQKYLQKKSSELNLGNDNSVLSINDAKRLHEMVNKSEIRKKIAYAKKSYEALKNYAQDNINDPDRGNDLNQLIQQSNRSSEFLSTLEKWVNLSPKSNNKEDIESYNLALGGLSREVKTHLNLTSGSSNEINEKLNFVINDPIRKAESIFTVRVYKNEESPFSKPFDTNQTKLTDYEKFRALMGTYSSIKDVSVQPGDQNLMAETRRLFESSDSNLRKEFESGIELLIDGIDSSPDPKSSRYMASQLCALAYSLPNSSVQHPIRKCTAVLPNNFSQFKFQDKRNYPDCAAYDYFKETTRQDYFNTGKNNLLPSAQGE